jgi:C1A family cysteine protease
MSNNGACGRYLCGLAVTTTLLLVLGGTSSAVAQLTPADIQALKEQGAKEGWTFEVGENDATAHSLDELCGFVKPDNWKELGRWVSFPADRGLPEYFDWRDYNGCTPIRNQGNCGSCWAFATVGPLECNIKIKDDVTVNLSEQWLVSCNRDGWGCNGGFMAHMYHEWKTDPCGDTGAVLEADFPYVASDVPCNCPYPHEYLIDGWAYIGGGVNAMKQAIIDYGPISVGVYANSAFQGYNGGVFNGCANGTPNHAVVLVGWDDNQGSNGVWFLRNSWGAGWGEAGYMRIPYGCSNVGDSACFIDYGGALPTLTFVYPDGIPDLLDPGVENVIRVNVLPDTGTPVPDTGWLHYSANGGESFFVVGMTELNPNEYEGVLPAADCYERYDWYVSVQEAISGERVSDPRTAPYSTYSSVVATGASVVVDDHFETDQGWEIYAGADTGNWERADPQEVNYYGTITQPGDDHTADGTRCYVTGPLAGSSAGSYDVDGGPTRLTSPVLDLEGIDATVSYWRWYHISTEWDDELAVKVSNDNGNSWVTVETVDDRETWTYVEWRVGDYVTPTSQVRVRFIASDNPNNSLVEALIDDFRVEALECEAPPDCPEDLNGDGEIDLSDLAILLTNYGITGAAPEDGDLDGDGDVDLTDLSALLAVYGTSCP